MTRTDIDALLESMSRRQHEKTLVKGVGISDATFCTGALIEGKIINHQAYDVWSGMLQRCYDPKFQSAHPHYTGCTVCDEWLTFTKFFAWWKENIVEDGTWIKTLCRRGIEFTRQKSACSSLNSLTTSLLRNQAEETSQWVFTPYQRLGSTKLLSGRMATMYTLACLAQLKRLIAHG